VINPIRDRSAGERRIIVTGNIVQELVCVESYITFK
jgi:hypothetical protein